MPNSIVQYRKKRVENSTDLDTLIKKTVKRNFSCFAKHIERLVSNNISFPRQSRIFNISIVFFTFVFFTIGYIMLLNYVMSSQVCDHEFTMLLNHVKSSKVFLHTFTPLNLYIFIHMLFSISTIFSILYILYKNERYYILCITIIFTLFVPIVFTYFSIKIDLSSIMV